MLCLGLGSTAAYAAVPSAVQVTAASPPVYPVSYPAPLQVIEGLGSGITIDQVAALPSERFVIFSPSKLYTVGFDAPLWLKLKVSVPQALPQSPWLLEFPSIIVDRYEYYQRDAAGRWRMAAAGDRVAHVQWPVDGLRARFQLPSNVAGDQDVFVRVVHQHHTNLQPVIVLQSHAVARDSSQMLWTGLLLGVVFTLVLTCAQMTLVYRDWTYGWYAGYLTFTMLAALCYSGIAQRSLWPDASKFASDAIVYAVMTAFIFNLEFSRSMFGGLQSRAMRWLSRVLVGLCACYLIATFLSDRYDRLIVLFEVLSLAVFSFIVFAAAKAWRGGVVFGGYWLMVYVPYLLCIALTLGNSAGFLNVPWLPAQTPVFAAIAEAVAMMLCINAYGRLRHAQSVREQEAARYDPLTGFLKEAVFNKKVSELWNNSKSAKRDLAVVYVTVDAQAADMPGTVDAEAVMARSVRQVRMVTRDFDLIGRLGRNRIGIAILNVPPREALSNRLARLVALGLMRDADDPTVLAARFSMSVGLRHSFEGDFDAVDRALRELLERQGPALRPIRFLDTEVFTRRVNAPHAPSALKPG